MNLYPFSSERRIGITYQIEGIVADVSFDAANKLPYSHFGERLGRGEVGEFVVIDVGGMAVFGRVLRVGALIRSVDELSHQKKNSPVEGRIQLLSTLHLDGRSVRGISKYPKVGDPVYAASAETIMAVLNSDSIEKLATISLGHLSVDTSVEVRVPLSRLFGRHLAIVGATGSGKSWTLARLADVVDECGGKMIIIDATGEYHTLGERAKHVAFASTEGEPEDTVLVGMSHYKMRETDRNAFLNPSSGTQLPKLREAIRSLKLAYAINSDNAPELAHKNLVDDIGNISKENVLIDTYMGAARKYSSVIESPYAPFSLRLLASQVQYECVWAYNRNDPSRFGSSDYQQIGYVSSLISRINDLTQNKEVMNVIDSYDRTGDAIVKIGEWFRDPSSHVIRVSLRNLTFANHLREIVVNIIGQELLAAARSNNFRNKPLIVAIDEAHQFFNITVGDEFANTQLNAFDIIAKEGRKYGLTVCLATQRPGDLPPDVLSQVGMTIAHRLADGKDRQRVEQAAAELDYSAVRLLPGLGPGEAILMGVDFPVPVSVRMNVPTARPASDGPRYENWGAE